MNDLQFSSLPQWPKGHSVPNKPQRLVRSEFPYNQSTEEMYDDETYDEFYERAVGKPHEY